MKLIRLLAVVVVLVSITPISKAQSVIDPNQQWGADNNGLRLGISPVVITYKDEPQIMFYIVFENTGKDDIILNLGIMLGNGKSQFPQSIRVILTDTGETRELKLSGPVGIAGRVDDFPVPIPAGGIYILRSNLNQYWCPSTNEFKIKLKKGSCKIAACFEGKGASEFSSKPSEITLMHFWKGKLESNTVKFEVK